MAGFCTDVGTIALPDLDSISVRCQNVETVQTKEVGTVPRLRLRSPRHTGPLPRMRCDSARGERSGDVKRMRRSASICVHLWLNTNSSAYTADRTCVRFRTLFELR